MQHMDVYDIRKANLRILIDRVETARVFAERVGTDPSYLSQITSPKGKKNVGNKFARSCETTFGLPHGWMDQPHGDSFQGISHIDLTELQRRYLAAGADTRRLVDTVLEMDAGAALSKELAEVLRRLLETIRQDSISRS